jgi:hypothetical protein
VAFFIGSEKLADTVALRATPTAPFTGEVDSTVGGVMSGDTVVKLQEKAAASALPAVSCASVVMVAVYWVLAARFAPGVSVAVFPATLTTPATAGPPAVGARVKLAAFSVALFIGSEKVADTVVFRTTPTAPFAGVIPATVGGVFSGDAVPPPPETSPPELPPPEPPPPHPERPTPASRIANVKSLILATSSTLLPRPASR